MAPVVPFIPLITGVLAAGATVATGVASAKQADKANKRQMDYQKALAAEQADSLNKEKMLNQQAEQRRKAYGASLLEDNTNMNNMLSGGYNDQQLGGSVLSGGLNSSVNSMFS